MIDRITRCVAAALTASFVMAPLATNAQNSGITTYQLCKLGQPGCSAGTVGDGNQTQNIPKGYYRNTPGTIGGGSYTNERPRINAPIRSLSCRQGKSVLNRYGYKRVRAIFCAGPFYTYRGRIGGRNYVITLRRSNGEVVNRYRI